MVQHNSRVRSTPLYGSKEGNDISILLESRTVIEKKDFVATGTLTYAHGDIIEIELPQYDVFSLKESVKIIVYSKSGMFVFDSTVVAKGDGSLVIINPPNNREKFIDKREHPRVEVKHTGKLSAIHDTSRGQPKMFDEPVTLAIDNISTSGAGFTADIDLGVNPGTELAVELDLGFPVTCRSEIVRTARTEHGFFYGIRFTSMSPDSSHALRAFVLRSQVEEYYRQKRDNRLKALTENKEAING